MSQIVVYLDNCCFNRPYDDQNQLSIFIETQAKLAIQEFVKDNKISLLWSFILDFENGANPDESVKNEIFLWRDLAARSINKNNDIVNNALIFNRNGFGKKDSLHIASAVAGQADFFITVDKGVLKKRNVIETVTIISPIEFIEYCEEITNEN